MVLNVFAAFECVLKLKVVIPVGQVNRLICIVDCTYTIGWVSRSLPAELDELDELDDRLERVGAILLRSENLMSSSPGKRRIPAGSLAELRVVRASLTAGENRSGGAGDATWDGVYGR